MALAPRGRAEPPPVPATTTTTRHWRVDRQTSPERTKVWTEPKPRKVPVVYYLSRNGQLEHPHFMEVPLAPGQPLHLRDVLDRLDSLRGKGIADGYSWSSKRSYKNGFVWHDLSDDDLIHPTHGHEYVIKGSELLHPMVSFPSSQEMTNSSTSTCENPVEMRKSVHRDDSEIGRIRRKKAAWSSFDLNEYKVYKTELTAETAVKAAVDASTQTDDRRSRRRPAIVVQQDDDDESRAEVPSASPDEEANPTTELEGGEISPPPSSSSTETLESLIKADVRTIIAASGSVAGPEDHDQVMMGGYAGGRMRASAVLRNLLSCGFINVKDHHSVGPQQKWSMLPRARSDWREKETDGLMESNAGFPAIRLEEKEYFSGSLIETKKKGSEDGVAQFPGLKRSSSYNADRSSKLDMVAEKEIDAARAKCIPRKPKSVIRREANVPISRSTLGSKRINDEFQHQN